jgi:hypothetical protein
MVSGRVFAESPVPPEIASLPLPYIHESIKSKRRKDIENLQPELEHKQVGNSG